jgi:hypothetical protein
MNVVVKKVGGGEYFKQHVKQFVLDLDMAAKDYR